MNWEAVGALGEAFGAFAVFISLIYLAIQVRQNTGQARHAAQRVMLDELGRALQSLAQNGGLAEIYVRGLHDFSSLTVPERARFSGFLGHALRIFQGLHAEHMAGTLDPDSWAGVEGLIKDVTGYPGVREYFDLRKHHFSPSFRRFMEEEMMCLEVPRRSLFGEGFGGQARDLPVRPGEASSGRDHSRDGDDGQDSPGEEARTPSSSILF